MYINCNSNTSLIWYYILFEVIIDLQFIIHINIYNNDI